MLLRLFSHEKSFDLVTKSEAGGCGSCYDWDRAKCKTAKAADALPTHEFDNNLADPVTYLWCNVVCRSWNKNEL